MEKSNPHNFYVNNFKGSLVLSRGEFISASAVLHSKREREKESKGPGRRVGVLSACVGFESPIASDR